MTWLHIPGLPRPNLFSSVVWVGGGSSSSSNDKDDDDKKEKTKNVYREAYDKGYRGSNQNQYEDDDSDSDNDRTTEAENKKTTDKKTTSESTKTKEDYDAEFERGVTQRGPDGNIISTGTENKPGDTTQREVKPDTGTPDKPETTTSESKYTDMSPAVEKILRDKYGWTDETFERRETYTEGSPKYTGDKKTTTTKKTTAETKKSPYETPTYTPPSTTRGTDSVQKPTTSTSKTKTTRSPYETPTYTPPSTTRGTDSVQKPDKELDDAISKAQKWIKENPDTAAELALNMADLGESIKHGGKAVLAKLAGALARRAIPGGDIILGKKMADGTLKPGDPGYADAYERLDPRGRDQVPKPKTYTDAHGNKVTETDTATNIRVKPNFKPKQPDPDATDPRGDQTTPPDRITTTSRPRDTDTEGYDTGNPDNVVQGPGSDGSVGRQPDIITSRQKPNPDATDPRGDQTTPPSKPEKYTDAHGNEVTETDTATNIRVKPNFKPKQPDPDATDPRGDQTTPPDRITTTSRPRDTDTEGYDTGNPDNVIQGPGSDGSVGRQPDIITSRQKPNPDATDPRGDQTTPPSKPEKYTDAHGNEVTETDTATKIRVKPNFKPKKDSNEPVEQIITTEQTKPETSPRPEPEPETTQPPANDPNPPNPDAPANDPNPPGSKKPAPEPPPTEKPSIIKGDPANKNVKPEVETPANKNTKPKPEPEPETYTDAHGNEVTDTPGGSYNVRVKPNFKPKPDQVPKVLPHRPPEEDTGPETGPTTTPKPPTLPEPVVDPGPEIRPPTQPNPNPQPDPNVQPQPQPQPEPEVDPSIQPQPEPEVAPQPDPNVQPQPEPEVAPQPDPNVQPQPEPEVAPQPDPNVQPQPQPRPEPGIAPAPAPAPAPRPNPNPNPQPRPEPIVDPVPTPRLVTDPKTPTPVPGTPPLVPAPAPPSPPGGTGVPDIADPTRPDQTIPEGPDPTITSPPPVPTPQGPAPVPTPVPAPQPGADKPSGDPPSASRDLLRLPTSNREVTRRRLNLLFTEGQGVTDSSIAAIKGQLDVIRQGRNAGYLSSIITRDRGDTNAPGLGRLGGRSLKKKTLLGQ